MTPQKLKQKAKGLTITWTDLTPLEKNPVSPRINASHAGLWLVAQGDIAYRVPMDWLVTVEIIADEVETYEYRAKCVFEELDTLISEIPKATAALDTTFQKVIYKAEIL